jgi:hypothetical protein
VACKETEKVHTGFLWGNPRERDGLENLCVDGRIILKWTLKKWNGVMDWEYLAQGRERYWAFVNAVMNFRVP